MPKQYPFCFSAGDNKKYSNKIFAKLLIINFIIIKTIGPIDNMLLIDKRTISRGWLFCVPATVVVELWQITNIFSLIWNPDK